MKKLKVGALRNLLAAAGTTLLFLLVATPVCAGEVEALAWEGQNVLKVRVKGAASYKVENLEQGQRLRLVFPDSTIGPALGELAGQGLVKGVYPYLAENGTAVNVDLLLSEPGRLDVQKTEDGYRIATVAAAAPAETQAPPAQPAPVAATSAKNSIQDILYAKLPGERIQITIKMSQPPAEPSAFTITNPARISLDFPGTRVELAKKTVNVKEGAVTSVTAVEAEDRTRVVLNLIKPSAYRTATDGNNFVVTVDSPTTSVSTEPPKVTHFAASKKGGKYSLKGVDFRRGPQGDGKVVITLSDPAVGIDVREQAGEVVLDFIDTAAPAELQRRLDVVDFATPVQTVDTFVQGKNTRMIISPKGKYEHIAFQTGNVFTVSIKPVIERADEKKVDEFGYSGEKLSLNFQNIDVRAALQVLADFTGLNFVVSDTVKGSLTLRLKDVPWDQAMDLIVDAKGLAVRRKGNVITIAPAAEVAAKEKAAFEASKANIELEPLISELIHINYAKADDIASLLKSIKPVAGGTAVSQAAGSSVLGYAGTPPASAQQTGVSSNTLLSPRGQVTVDVRSNSVLVQDTAAKIVEIRKLIAQLDQPVRQVMVETRLVEATDNFAKSLGARLGHHTAKTHGNDLIFTTGTNAELPKFFPVGGGTPVHSFPEVYSVNLPSPGIGTFSPGALSVSFFSGWGQLDLELSALEQEGLGKIISSPRVITANQKKALIEQGQERIFTTITQGTVAVTTKRATLKLEVTPQITPDERVDLDVNITKDNFTDSTSGNLNVKNIQTDVLLDNGETVVIGGIFEQDKNTTTTQVPFFGDIPLLGWLFKNKESRDNKTELLIFLTPRILSPQLTLR